MTSSCRCSITDRPTGDGFGITGQNEGFSLLPEPGADRGTVQAATSTRRVEGRKRAGGPEGRALRNRAACGGASGDRHQAGIKPSPALFGPSNPVGPLSGGVPSTLTPRTLLSDAVAPRRGDSGRFSSDSPLFFTVTVARRLLSVATLLPLETVLLPSFEARLRRVAAPFTGARGQSLTFDPVGRTSSEARPAAQAVAAFSRPAGLVPTVRA